MKYKLTLLMLVALAPIAYAQEATRPAAPAVDLDAAAERSPAVAAVLDSPRETPAQILSAVLTLIDLREFDVAEVLLRSLADAGLSPADRAELVREFGTARFLALSRESKANQIAGGSAFAESTLAASAAEAARPERLRELIADLASADAVTRDAARNDLASTGLPAVQAVLEALAVSTDKTERGHLLAGLEGMSPTIDPLVIAALAEGSGQFRRDVAELAGHLHMLEAVPWLATIAAGGEDDQELATAAQAALLRMGLSLPDEADALATVRRELERVDAGIPTDSLPNETGLWWSFDPSSKKFASVELINCERRSLIHARLAANLLILPNASSADRELAIISAVEASHILGVPPSPRIAELAETLPTSSLNAALLAAIKSNRINAAVACAELLAERADPAALQSIDGSSTPLALAAAHPNRQLKFAALHAIMRIGPGEGFPGASYVPEGLWELAAGSGTPQAVVGSSTVARATDWAGHLRGLGYDATPVATGIELVKKSVESPRLSMVLVDSDIGRPLVREVLFQLRSQPRLAHTPVALLTSNSDAQLGYELAKADGHLLAVARPRSPEATKAVVDRLMQLAGPQLTADERTAQAVQAIKWIDQLLADGSHYGELLRDASMLEQAVYNPDLTDVSLRALANIGTASSQRALVDFASLESQPLELRRLAVESFATSRERFGVLLSAAEIVRQYDRYNASETADSDTQQILGKLLDTLEDKPIAQ